MINDKRIVSLDVFDTAILRRTYLPTDIFKIIEEKVGNDFYNKRIEAEKQAREEYPFYGIADIYKHLPEFDMELEIDTELENCYANQDILDLYNFTIQDFVFISDMYLPSEVLIKMLEKCGYKTPEVYVSCEIGACKSTGELFKKVEEITGKKITAHYGDNYVADIEGAKRAGIEHTVFNPALHNKNLNLPKVRNTYLKKYLATVEDTCEPVEKLALFHVPLIMEFTKWVLNERKEGQKIFFLSRDMYMPYIIAKDVFKAKDIYYLYVSRRSLAGICLKSGNEELRRKMSFIFSEEEMEERERQDDGEVLKYLKKFDIRNGDIIADIGYAGTIQAGINYALGVDTVGCYMQVSSNVLSGLRTKMFLGRMAIHFCLMVEFVLGSDEDCVEGYSDGKPVFVAEDSARKEFARMIIDDVLEVARGYKIPSSVYDIEQILIHQQYYPDAELIKLYNRKIYSNRERRESIIGFDVAEIVNGGLREAYRRSYCQPLFRALLEQNKDLKHLSRLL